MIVRANYRDHELEIMKICREMFHFCYICDLPIGIHNDSQCPSCKRYMCYDHADHKEITGRVKVCQECKHKCQICGKTSEEKLKKCDTYQCQKTVCDSCKPKDCSCGQVHDLCGLCYAPLTCAGGCGGMIYRSACSNVRYCKCDVCVLRLNGYRPFCVKCWLPHKEELLKNN